MFNDLYLVNENISNKVNEMIRKFDIDEGEFSEGILILEDLIHLHLIKDFKKNTIKKIIIPTFYYQVLVKETSNFSTLSFHAEHAVMKLTTFWEHLFQILNTYLGINNLPRRVIEKNEEWGIFKTKFKLIKKNKFRKYVSANNKILTRTGFLKNIKKKYRVDTHLRNLINLSNKSNWNKIRDFRNDIIHQKFIGQSAFVFDTRDEDYSMEINNNFEEDFDYQSLSILFSEAVEDVRKALADTFILIKKGLVPNKKSSLKDQQFLLKIKCECKADYQGIPDIFLQFEEELKKEASPFKGVFCPNCFSDEIIILEEKVKVNEDTWNQIVTDYYQKSILYLEKKLKDLNRDL